MKISSPEINTGIELKRMLQDVLCKYNISMAFDGAINMHRQVIHRISVMHRCSGNPEAITTFLLGPFGKVSTLATQIEEPPRKNDIYTK